VEEERACGMNLDGEHVGGVDLNTGGSRHGTGVEVVSAASRPMWRSGR
jgi:hypothetical protein